MGGHYEKDVMKQLQEVMERLDKTEQEVKDTKKAWKKEVKELKADFAAERKKLKTEIKELKTELTVVKAENKQLKEQVKTLENENSKLRSQINNDSNNSSNPPSSDPKGKKVNTYNSRVKSQKSCGGQDNHKGVTITKKDIEKLKNNKEVEFRVRKIGTERKKYISRYVLDYEIKPVVTELRFYEDETGKINIPKEYRSLASYGDTIKALATDMYIDGVVSNNRICNFLNTIGGNIYNISTGSVYNFVNEFSRKIEKDIEKIAQSIISKEVMYTDATTVTVNGEQTYIRNQSTTEEVLYSGMKSKSIESIKENTVLKDYKGILEHDHETAIYNFGTGHGECNVHLLRYLKKNTEETNSKWSDRLSKLLTKANIKRKAVLNAGSWFTTAEIDEIEKEYEKIIKKGYKENEKTKHKYAKEDEKALLNRLVKYRENHLLFIYDSRVPFDNNISERDLRKCKNRQKMSGGFRTEKGRDMYCRILSVVETGKRKKENIFDMIKNIFSTPVEA